MTTQQEIFLTAIAGIRRALKRKAYESDSDESIDHNGNRGQKLKKRARFTRQGQLAPPSGPEVYREEVEYAGARRSILHRNPPLLDEDGYEIESDDDEERIQEAMASAAELNPYAGIRLEHVLAPLTSVTDLPTHQTLSVAYTSKTLTNLADQASDLSRKENKSLWKVKHLLTGLCGDYIWAPSALMLGPNDAALYSEDYVEQMASRRTLREADGSSPGTLNGDARMENEQETSNGELRPTPVGATNGHTNGADTEMADTDKEQTPQHKARAQGAKNLSPDGQEQQEQAEDGREGSRNDWKGRINKAGEFSAKALPRGAQMEQGQMGTSNAGGESMEMADAGLPRATQPEVSNGTRQPTGAPSDASGELFIHPFFAIPPNARPDKDMGLPENEADNVRHLIALYVQKQEEICRGATRLHEGLLKADRLRKTVLKWAKAEAHCGPARDMSDGEDWYDWEEWGLEEDLKKGQDEEEEDTATTTKKTRNRK